MTQVTRHFVDVAGREVNLRRSGGGPPVVLLHESPRSSVALSPLMSRIADRFTVYGFDTPGFGGSDALTLDSPDAADYADALAETLDVLGYLKYPCTAPTLAR
ncbi:MAG: hypothetical protein HOI95_25065 [Chromatiales bacterium]|jgi:pimeloyl-ACP methyl ester carboxylesterase|nr:hypothetical protein [Chromatiales bacterium]